MCVCVCAVEVKCVVEKSFERVARLHGSYTVYNLCKYFNLVCARSVLFTTPSLHPESPSSVEHKSNSKIEPTLDSRLDQNVFCDFFFLQKKSFFI